MPSGEDRMRHADRASLASNASFARWNSSSGFCTQSADNSTNRPTSARLAAWSA